MVYATGDQAVTKVTRFKEFHSQWDCNIALEKLEKEFEMGETAMCYKTGRTIPKLDSIY